MFVLIFYALSPVPTLIARRFAESVEQSSVLIEICIFVTACIVVSAYGLPIVLARATDPQVVKTNNFSPPPFFLPPHICYDNLP